MPSSNKPSLVARRRELGLTIGEVSRAWRYEINERLRPFGLNQSMQQVLMQLHRSPHGMMQRELARRLGIEDPTLVRLLDLLEREGWVKRLASGDDKRRKVCVLTEQAQGQIAVIEQVMRELRGVMMKGMSAAEVELALDIMQRMRDNLVRCIDGATPER